ncbi:GNAT family N-acetyltransferase [Devosia sp. CAU 1758]
MMLGHVRMRKLLASGAAERVPPAGVVLMPVTRFRPVDLHSLLNRSYAKGGGEVPPVEDWWWSMIRDAEFDPDLMIIAADDEGEPIGLLHCWTSSFIKDLVVEPHNRDRGLGSFLLQASFAILAARGNAAVDLKVHTDNLGARRFYARHGMVELPD